MMATSSTPRVYIDACYYIDVAKGRLGMALDPPDREQHLPWIEALLLAGLAGDVEIYASTLILSECLHVDSQSQIIPEHVQETFVSLLTSGSAVKLIGADYFVAERARDLLWVDRIKCGGGADMIHVATALDTKCAEFITTNRKRGPLQAIASLAKLGLTVIEAPQTQALPPQYVKPLLMSGGA
jgi:hypothetical protein